MYCSEFRCGLAFHARRSRITGITRSNAYVACLNSASALRLTHTGSNMKNAHVEVRRVTRANLLYVRHVDRASLCIKKKNSQRRTRAIVPRYVCNEYRVVPRIYCITFRCRFESLSSRERRGT